MKSLILNIAKLAKQEKWLNTKTLNHVITNSKKW